MHYKAIFLDIDGTLVSFKTHDIPESTIQALTTAKEKGLKIFISTGRPPHIITNLTKIEHLIDGFVSTNGAYCYIGNRDICFNTIDKSDVDYIVSRCTELRKSVIVVTKDNMAVINPGEQFDRLFVDLLNIKNITSDQKTALQMLSQPVIQLTPFIDDATECDILANTRRCIAGRWHPEFTDITSSSADKGKGLACMAEALGINTEETIAFGDGGNDIPIIRQAGLGIAMGNACDELKANAKYVTTSVDADGIMNALRHFNIA